MKTAAIKLLLKTAVQSFWNGYYAIPDPFEGLIYRRPSTQKTDTYTRLGAAPMPQQWVGDRRAKPANEYSFDITNQPYESTARIDKETVKYQQWDEVASYMRNLGMKAKAHQTKLATTTIVAGVSTVCEDGKFFFDTDHASPGAEYTTSQDNDKTSTAATGTQPTELEFASALRTAMDALYSFKDDRGDPTVPENDDPANMIVMVPPVYRSVAQRVQKADALTGPVGNDLRGTFTVRVNPFLTGVDQFFLFYGGSMRKPVIIQETGGVRLSPLEEEKATGDWVGGADWWGAVGYGEWRTAVSHIFT